MSEFDRGYKRLGIILSLFIVLSLMYACEHVFFNVAQTDVLEDSLSTTVPDDYYNKTTMEDEGIDVIGFFQFMTFTIPDIPAWMILFLAPFSLMLNVVLGYMIVDVVYAWIKALPFT